MIKFSILGRQFCLGKQPKQPPVICKPSIDQNRMTSYLTDPPAYKEINRKYKVSFCPGDKRKCARSKLQTCNQCRKTHLDWNIRSDFIDLTVQQPIVKPKPLKPDTVLSNEELDQLQRLVIPSQ